MKQKLLFAGLTACLIAFSLPPFRSGFIAWFAIVPFFYLLSGLESRKDAFKWGYLTGLFTSILVLYWLFYPAPPGAVATILIYPLYYGLFGLAFVSIKNRHGNLVALIAAPFLWTAVEYLKAIGELGFPWITLGYSQSYYTYFIQYASITSVYGVSFWVVVLNSLVTYMVLYREERKQQLSAAALFLLAILFPLIHGLLVVPSFASTVTGRHIRVGVVQGNIDAYIKWDKRFRELSFEKYERLSKTLTRDSLDVIIWPETATPAYLLKDQRRLSWIRRLFHETNTPIMTGIQDYIFLDRKNYKTFNSVTLIDNLNGPYRTYAKTHLVPFGERVPWEDDFALLKKLLSRFEMGEGNFSPGDGIVLFPLALRNGRGTAKTGSVICFESTFPELVADFVRKGAELLVIVTNDAWFKKSPAPYQHAQMAVFRAIENRTSIARSANTGVSMTIDPWGRVRKQTAIFVDAAITDVLPLRQQTTFFTRNGHVFANVVLLISLILFLLPPGQRFTSTYVKKNV